jgi:hypothetical protein
MKRRFLNAKVDHAAVPDDLAEYVTELQVLRYVPLSYLVADSLQLPGESIRFFYVDGNWTEALADGALSIGRVTSEDAAGDRIMLGVAALPKARSNLHLPRRKLMHSNHRKRLVNMGAATSGKITGFIMRSELVRQIRGLEVSAYKGQTELVLLRFDIFSDRIALGLFDGELDRLIIAEPKTGLTFGLAQGEKSIRLKDITEDNWGKYIDGKDIEIKGYVNDQGRINASALAAEMSKRLNGAIGSGKFAFEMIAIANRASFEKQ